MALNPVVYTEKVVRSFLRYQLTAYPFADECLHGQMRALLSLDETRQSPLLKGPYVSLSRSFREGAAVDALIHDGVIHPPHTSADPCRDHASLWTPGGRDPRHPQRQDDADLYWNGIRKDGVLPLPYHQPVPRASG